MCRICTCEQFRLFANKHKPCDSSCTDDVHVLFWLNIFGMRAKRHMYKLSLHPDADKIKTVYINTKIGGKLIVSNPDLHEIGEGCDISLVVKKSDLDYKAVEFLPKLCVVL